MDFFKNILLLPESFMVHRDTFEVANFSFDMRDQNTKTSKEDYVKHSLLNFLLKRENLLIEYQLEDQLFETIRVYEQKLKQGRVEPTSSKDPENAPEKDKQVVSTREAGEIETYTKGTLTECLKGINLMIQNQSVNRDTQRQTEESDPPKQKDSNVFLKNSDGKEVRSPDALRSSRNNVGLHRTLTRRSRTCPLSRTSTFPIRSRFPTLRPKKNRATPSQTLGEMSCLPRRGNLSSLCRPTTKKTVTPKTQTPWTWTTPKTPFTKSRTRSTPRTCFKV